MNFGRIAFGALIVAVGVLLLAVRTGFAPTDTPFILVRYWPLLLIAFGLAFLAGAIKNPFLGCLSVVVILGGLVLGLYWVKSHHGHIGPEPKTVSVVDLGKVKVESISLVVRTLAGNFHVASGAQPTRRLDVRVRTFSPDSTVRYRFHVVGSKAVFEWPLRAPVFGLPVPGQGVDVHVPEGVPMSLGWKGWLSSVRADLARLRPTICSIDGTCSSVILGINGASRPSEINIRGFASDVKLRVQGDCPIRLVCKAPMVMPTLPSDFVEHAPGRGKDRIFTGEGKGAPVRIVVDGPAIRIKIERVAQGVELTGEGWEWQGIATASRFRSRS